MLNQDDTDDSLSVNSYIYVHSVFGDLNQIDANVREIMRNPNQSGIIQLFQSLSASYRRLDYFTPKQAVLHQKILGKLNPGLLSYGSSFQIRLHQGDIELIKRMKDIDLCRIFQMVESTEGVPQELQELMERRGEDLKQYNQLFRDKRQQMYEMIQSERIPHELRSFCGAYQKYCFVVPFGIVVDVYLRYIKVCGECRSDFKSQFGFEGGQLTEQRCVHELLFQCLELNCQSVFENPQYSLRHLWSQRQQEGRGYIIKALQAMTNHNLFTNDQISEAWRYLENQM